MRLYNPCPPSMPGVAAERAECRAEYLAAPGIDHSADHQPERSEDLSLVVPTRAFRFAEFWPLLLVWAGLMGLAVWYSGLSWGEGLSLPAGIIALLPLLLILGRWYRHGLGVKVTADRLVFCSPGGMVLASVARNAVIGIDRFDPFAPDVPDAYQTGQQTSPANHTNTTGGSAPAPQRGWAVPGLRKASR